MPILNLLGITTIIFSSLVKLSHETVEKPEKVSKHKRPGKGHTLERCWNRQGVGREENTRGVFLTCPHLMLFLENLTLLPEPTQYLKNQRNSLYSELISTLRIGDHWVPDWYRRRW